MPTKKATKTSKTPKAERAPGAKQTGMLSWFFKPDLTQGWKKWLLRAGLFAVAFLVAVFFLGVVGIQAEFASAGAVVPTFRQTAEIVAALALQQPFSVLVFAAALYAIGMFLFMPRRYLDKTGFAALYIPFTLLCFVMTFALLLAAKYEREFQNPAIMLSICMGLMLAVFAGMVASVVCYARKNGISRTALFLSFPFGLTFYELAGLFLPSKDKDRIITIKANWYRALIDFLLFTKNGQIILAAGYLAMFSVSYSPNAPFATFLPGLIMVALFAALYFGKTQWLSNNMKKMSWLAVIENAASFAIFYYFFQAVAGAIAAA